MEWGQIPCPGNWSRHIQQLPTETEQDCYRRIFQEYMPNVTITCVQPKNNRRKPRCMWDVHFTNLTSHGLPVDVHTTRHLLAPRKPRNTTIQLGGVGAGDYIITYKMECECGVMRDFCSENDQAKMVNSLEKLQQLKLEV